MHMGACSDICLQTAPDRLRRETNGKEHKHGPIRIPLATLHYELWEVLENPAGGPFPWVPLRIPHSWL